MLDSKCKGAVERHRKPKERLVNRISQGCKNIFNKIYPEHQLSLSILLYGLKIENYFCDQNKRLSPGGTQIK